MKIETDDYEVINRYAGPDRSWHDRVNNRLSLDFQIFQAREEAKLIIDDMKTFARIQDRLALKRQGDNQ